MAEEATCTLALLSLAPVFPLRRVLTTAPGGSVSPGQHKYFLDMSCFTFSLHAPHCPAPQSCLHHPGGKPPSSRHSGGPSPGPTHVPPSPPREGRCTPSSLGGPVDRIPSPLRPGAIFQRASGEGWGASTCVPHPSLSKGQGRGEGTRPSCGPRSPRLLKTELCLAAGILEAASQTRRLSPSLGTQMRGPPGHHQG